ncbi:MAG: glycosyltransferase family 39 protein [Armatimonadetes bacterium]|nr:glycosyltransferase family 39 protein [Armatimonadota bacterium]
MDHGRTAVDRRRWLRLGVLLVLAFAGQGVELRFREPLSDMRDRDGYMKLCGIARHPTLRDALLRFVGDDPQGVHTFRPLPAFTLFVEYRLWGFCRWPYQIVNILGLLLTALVLERLCRTIGLPPPAAAAVGVLLLVDGSQFTRVIAGCIATRHDLLCVLFCLLAYDHLIRWLRGGPPRDLAAYAGWSLLAYLSKEMALALVPLTCGAALFTGLRRREARRALAAVGVSAAVAAVWYGWFRLAEANMGPSPHVSHSLGGMLGKLRHVDSVAGVLFLYQLCWPLGDIVRTFRADPSFAALLGAPLQKDFLKLALFCWACWMLIRHQPGPLVWMYLWKITTYLPVLPLHDTWSWYGYMPKVLNGILPAGALWHWWHSHGGRERVGAMLDRRLAWIALVRGRW